MRALSTGGQDRPTSPGSVGCTRFESATAATSGRRSNLENEHWHGRRLIIAMHNDHGMVLRAKHIDYSDLTVIGGISITRGAGRQLEIGVSGFEFEDGGSCRQTSAKAIAWARDVLSAALDAQVLIPGGASSIIVVAD
jgi:hypothetical protein